MMHHETGLYCPKCHGCLPGTAGGQGEAYCRCGVTPVPEPTYKSSDIRFNPRLPGARFEPRLISTPIHRLVQVHPKVIEVFDRRCEYLCQVRWVAGELVCPHGGLPREDLERMFREANP